MKEFSPPIPRRNVGDAIRKAREEQALAERRRIFAWSHRGVESAQFAFDELAPMIHAIATEFDLQLGVDYVLERIAFRYLFGAAGWWVTIAWEPVAGNTLESAFLNVRKWSSHPPWPDRFLTQRASELTLEQYEYGLTQFERHGWMSNLDGRPFTTRQIVEKLFNDLFLNPNSNPATTFDLGG